MAAIVNDLPFCTHRYALFVSYLGTRYNGSQRLAARDDPTSQETIQECVEWSLEQFLGRKRSVLTTSSRTDKGVHSLATCYTLPLMDFSMPTEKMKRLINSNLVRKKHDIIVNEVLLVPSTFHPCKHVVSRDYIYRLTVAKNARISDYRKVHRPTDWFHLLPSTEIYRTLPLPHFDYDKALQAIDLLRGTHDFMSFSSYKKEEDTIRTLDVDLSEPASCTIDQSRDSSCETYQLRFRSRAFLQNQIRRMVGAILSYATYGSINLGDIRNLLDNPSPVAWSSRILVAEPWGLFLSRTQYPKESFSGTIKNGENNEILDYEESLEQLDLVAESNEAEDVADETEGYVK